MTHKELVIEAEKQLKRYMRAGFNLVAMTEDFVKAESQAYLNCLRLCEKLGLDVYIRGCVLPEQ